MRAPTLGITGYADRISVRPGEAIRFYVSLERPAPFRADLVRVVCGDCNSKGPGFKEVEIASPANGEYPGRHQPIRAGSYAVVPGAAGLDAPGSFSLVVAAWPTTPGGREQALLSWWSEERRAGFELLLDAAGRPALRLGDGAGQVATVATDLPLRPAEWCLIAASVDVAGGTVRLWQQLLAAHREARPATAEATLALRPAAAGTPLLMAARLQGTDRRGRITAAHYNGKLEAPRLARGALPLAALMELAQEPVPPQCRPALIGAWDFAIDIPGCRVADLSGNALEGETVNLPARAVTGRAWTGAEMRWTAAPHHYAAIHFHDDDIYDAGWEPDLDLVVPDDLPSGSYALRLRSGADEDYIPFFVRPPAGRATAPVLLLAQTATYMAYANISFAFQAAGAELLANRLVMIQPWEEHLNLHPELGGSLYDVHSDGSGICYSSRLRPVLNMRPKVQLSTAGLGSMLWGYNADTHLTDWLEATGQRFDVATDEDLHREGTTLLSRYRVVLTCTHPEYYSAAMLQAMQDYLGRGGRLMYMGGNGFYWRIAYHPTLPGVIEVRRAEDGTRAWIARPGEYYHSFTGEYGGLWRRQGRPPQALVGTGFIAQGFDHSAGYYRTPASEDPRVAFAFAGIGRDETIGDFGLLGGGAAGLEVDIVDPALGTPPHTLVVASSYELPDTFLLVNEEQAINTPDTLGTTNPRIRSDLAFHETPNGGAVFAFSSIAWCGSLAHNGYDNNVSRLTANVLRRFIDETPF
jgi:N,N-dimethylformamidase